MQTLEIDHHGPLSALTVRDVLRPAIGPQEVLIAIEAAAINPSDIASAEGRFEHAPLPRILGHDFAGLVCDGPTDLIGQDVWVSGGDLGIWRDGTHAEYLAIPRDGVALRPRELSVEEAAAVGVPFFTAWAALMDRGGLQAGEWVIISGASGAVGNAAVQIAAARHAKVIALVRHASDDARVDARATVHTSAPRGIQEPMGRILAESKISALAAQFPSLKTAPGVSPWDPDALNAWAATPAHPGDQARWAARFILNLWDPSRGWSAG